MPTREWTDKDKRRTCIMLNKIDDQLFKRKFMRSLEVLVGGRKTETDKRLLQRINWRDLPRDIPLARIEVLRYDTKGVKVRIRLMKTKIELTLEQTQQGVSDEVLNIRVMLHSIHSDDGNPTSANIKQALRQNHKAITIVGNMEIKGQQVVQQFGIQCFNYKGFGHFAKECRLSKRVKDSSYQKEKMMVCKQEEDRVQLSAEQHDRLIESDDEPIDQELEARYLYMAKIQQVIPASDEDTGPTYDTEPLEKVHSNDEHNVFSNEREHNIDQHAEQYKDERVLLASLIANLKLDIDENKKINKELKKANTSLTFELEKYKHFQRNDKEKEEVERKCAKALGTLTDYQRKCEEFIKQQGLQVYNVKEENSKLKEQICTTSFSNPKYLKKAQWEKSCLYNVIYDKDDLVNLFAPESEETIRFVEESRSKLFAQAAFKNAVDFEKTLNEEMLEDLKYVQTLEKEVDSLKKKLIL
ncbi:retrovirus-related pol polyprotein from transposon TNT 1-94 [Tanacetum coccineum]|uniref:Retrovirus-related pol polyprotein from transposon TNT 1-94 n=1 Tax=Tanacetum coccineum TaxID=301880 RepID=A0ABQ5CS99_9ASTR